MDSADLLALSAAIVSLLLGGFLLWRTARLLTLEPECAELASASGPVREAQLDRPFYGSRWLDLTVDSTPLRVAPGPAVRQVLRAVRRDPVLHARFCPASGGGRPRLWEAHQAGRPLVTVASQRADARASARVTLSGALLALLIGGLAGSAFWSRWS